MGLEFCLNDVHQYQCQVVLAMLKRADMDAIASVSVLCHSLP